MPDKLVISGMHHFLLDEMLSQAKTEMPAEKLARSLLVSRRWRRTSKKNCDKACQPTAPRQCAQLTNTRAPELRCIVGIRHKFTVSTVCYHQIRLYGLMTPVCISTLPGLRSTSTDAPPQHRCGPRNEIVLPRELSQTRHHHHPLRNSQAMFVGSLHPNATA